MVLFRVDDMTCGHCAGTLAKALAEADKGALVEFDVKQRLVRVQPEAASVAELQEAMQDAGYHPVLATAEPAVRAGSCGCGCR